MEMEKFGSALDKNVTELTVMDVYDVASNVGQEFERMIDRYGCEALLRLMPKVVRILEVLEVLVTRNAANTETEELRQELDRLRRERNDRYENERKHQKELEMLEDVWRGEIQDLLSQISQLQSENNRLLACLSIKTSIGTEQEPQKKEGSSEEEQQAVCELRDMVTKQRDKLRAKDHQLSVKNQDIDALQMQQLRLMKMNQELRHRLAKVERQGKAVIQQRTEMEVAAQARLREVGTLQHELSRLKAQSRAWELDRETEVAEKELRNSLAEAAGNSSHVSAQTAPLVPTPDSTRRNSIWVECGGEAGFLAGGAESEKVPLLSTTSTDTEEAEDVAPLSMGVPQDEEEEASEEAELERDLPHFTLQELQHVLQERNELKAQVFLLEEELAYYKSEELEDEMDFVAPDPAPPCSAPAAQPESGIRRLIFTAIMPMVAAGLIQDDPTLLPIRRLYSFI